MAEKKKLTVRVDRRWIEPAKAYAREHGTSLSALISEFLRRVAKEDREHDETPILRRLSGILPPEVSSEEQRDQWVKKYGE